MAATLPATSLQSTPAFPNAVSEYAVGAAWQRSVTTKHFWYVGNDSDMIINGLIWITWNHHAEPGR
jgi:hypothetical protein